MPTAGWARQSQFIAEYDVSGFSPTQPHVAGPQSLSHVHPLFPSALCLISAHQGLGLTAWLRELVLPCQKGTEWKKKELWGAKKTLLG